MAKKFISFSLYGYGYGIFLFTNTKIVLVEKKKICQNTFTVLHSSVKV